MKLLTFCFLFFAAHLSAQPPNIDRDIFDPLVAEIKRSEKLQLEDYPKPYFLSFRVSQYKANEILASGGQILYSAQTGGGYLLPEVRVGNYDFDESPDTWESSQVRGFVWNSDDPKVTRQHLWFVTDGEYKAACNLYNQKKAKRSAEGIPDYVTDDFTREKAMRYSSHEGATSAGVFSGYSTETIKRISLLLSQDPRIYYSQIRLSAKFVTVHFVNSEGTEIVYDRPEAVIYFSLSGQSKKGLALEVSKNFYVPDPKQLPTEELLKKEVAQLQDSYFRLWASSEAHGMSGPCLLDAAAASQLMIAFASRLEGERQRDPNEPQTFRDKIGENVLPAFLTLTDDPTMESYKGQKLMGHYIFDEEGVTPQPVALIDQGVLKGFLLSRRPIKGLPLKSNGHGRADPYSSAHARVGNLMISSERKKSDADLRAMLLEEIRNKKLPFGIIIEGLEAFHPESKTGSHQTFRAKPELLYYLYADGHQELVQNGEIVGTPINLMQSILATSDREEVFNLTQEGSGGTIAASVVTPAILVSEIEVQKGSEQPMRLPILKSPLAE